MGTGRMPQYHGDIMDRIGTVYERADDRNYPVAMVLLWIAGFTGAHRFFLNDHTIGWLYLGGLFVSCVLGFAMLDIWIPLAYFGIASIALLAEFVYFIYAWSRR